MPGASLSARDTVWYDTPAARATSRMVRRAGCAGSATGQLSRLRLDYGRETAREGRGDRPAGRADRPLGLAARPWPGGQPVRGADAEGRATRGTRIRPRT